jgi:hypothetical protein
MGDITFVHGMPGKSQSIRSRELQLARIRSHAAKHVRRKTTTSAGQSLDVGQKSFFRWGTVNDPPIRRPPSLPSILALLSLSNGSTSVPRSAGEGAEKCAEDEVDGPGQTIPSPASIIGQGRNDPFHSVFAATLPSFVLKYMELGMFSCRGA